MSEYEKSSISSLPSGNVQYSISLTENQKKQLNNAAVKRQAVNLRLKSTQLVGNDKLMLTKRQIQKINKHREKHLGIDLKLSASQLKNNQKGGFLPLAALIPAIAAIAKTVALPLAVSAGSAAATNIINKVMNKGSGVAVSAKDANELTKLVQTMEGKGILPAGSKKAVQNYVKNKSGDFVVPLLKAIYSGSGIYLPWEKN